MKTSLRPFGDYFPQCGKRVYIDSHAVVIGNVSLGEDASVWPMSVVRGDVNAIHIGRATNIQDGAILHVTHDGPWTPGGFALVLGDGVTIAHQAVLHGCRIDDYSLIGTGAQVMDGAHVEHHVLLAAGSLVPPGKRLESGWLYRGSPAQAVRALTEDEMRKLEYSAAHYVRLKDRYLAMMDAAADLPPPAE